MNEVIKRDTLSEVLKFLKQNTRLSAVKSLATTANIDEALMAKIIKLVVEKPYVVSIKFPTGKFKSYKFTMYGKGFAYMDSFVVIINGEIYDGSTRLSASALSNYDKTRAKDKLAVLGLPVIGYQQFMATLVDDLYNELNSDYLEKIVKDTHQKELDERYKFFIKFPHTLELYKQLELKATALTSEIEKLEQKHAEMKKDYDHEYKEARSGHRTKQEPYQVYDGTEEMFIGYSYDNYWFDDEPVKNPRYQTVDKYKTLYKVVADYPTEPEYQYDKLDKLKDEYSDVINNMNSIKSRPNSTEEHIMAELKYKQDEENYRKEKKALDEKYGCRFK